MSSLAQSPAQPISQPPSQSAPPPVALQPPVEIAGVISQAPSLHANMALASTGLSVVAPPADGGDVVGLLDLSSLDLGQLPSPASGFQFGSHAFHIDAARTTLAGQVADLVAPLTLTYSVDPAELVLAGGDLSRIQVALRSGQAWLGLGCSGDPAARVLTCTAPAAGDFVTIVAPPPNGRPVDWDVPGGHVFTQTNGFGGGGNLGYTVMDDADAAFWSEFQRLGGVDVVGYPIGARFQYRGFLTQAFQKLALQWRPDLGAAVPVNVLDDLSQHGSDAWLSANRQIPRAQITSDAGLDWESAVARHLAMLDAYPGLRDYYAARPDAVDGLGLPAGIDSYGPLVSVRLQRATLQLWLVDTPWAAAGTVVVGNAGDLAKQAGLWPLDAVAPVSVVQPD